MVAIYVHTYICTYVQKHRFACVATVRTYTVEWKVWWKKLVFDKLCVHDPSNYVKPFHNHIVNGYYRWSKTCKIWLAESAVENIAYIRVCMELNGMYYGKILEWAVVRNSICENESLLMEQTVQNV